MPFSVFGNRTITAFAATCCLDCVLDLEASADSVFDQIGNANEIQQCDDYWPMSECHVVGRPKYFALRGGQDGGIVMSLSSRPLHIENSTWLRFPAWDFNPSQ